MATMKMQLSDPKWYFENYVLPTYRDFMNDKLSRHKAANAITMTFHFWERLYQFYKERNSPYLYGCDKSSQFKELLISKCPDLILLNLAARAAKHQIVSVPVRARLPDIRQMTVSGVTDDPWLEASSTSVTLVDHGRIVVDGTGGRTVEDVLTSVMNFWCEWLKNHS